MVRRCVTLMDDIFDTEYLSNEEEAIEFLTIDETDDVGPIFEEDDVYVFGAGGARKGRKLVYLICIYDIMFIGFNQHNQSKKLTTKMYFEIFR